MYRYTKYILYCIGTDCRKQQETGFLNKNINITLENDDDIDVDLEKMMHITWNFAIQTLLLCTRVGFPNFLA